MTTLPVQNPPIQMIFHYFEEAEVKVNPKFTSQAEQVMYQTTIWSSLYQNPSDDSNLILKMLIKLPYPENNNVLISASFLVVGVFTVSKDYGTSDQDKAMLVKSTGGGMIYGAAREFILQVTARCSWDNRPLYLPTFPMDAIANCPPIESFIPPPDRESVKINSSQP